LSLFKADRIFSGVTGWRHSGFSVQSKVRAETQEEANFFLIIEQEEPFVPSKGWAEMIRKV
jgi:hypothetical protein